MDTLIGFLIFGGGAYAVFKYIAWKRSIPEFLRVGGTGGVVGNIVAAALTDDDENEYSAGATLYNQVTDQIDDEIKYDGVYL